MKADDSHQATSRSNVVFINIFTLLLQFIFGAGTLARYALLMVLFIVPFGYALSFFENAESYSLAKPILFYDQKLSFCANLVFPEAIKGYDFTPLFLIITALFSLKLVREISSRASNYAKYFTIKETINEMHLPGNIGDASDLNEKLASLKHTGQIDGKQSRDELLKVLGEVQRNLDSMKRDLAFLAIDVVDSTGMKVGEETSNVELDFMEYKKLVEKAFRENGYLKAAWTPDGVMACFNTPNAAVKAAKQVLKGLKIFNRDTKVINRDFIVRCGVNAGKVAFDDNMPMEEMSDRVIDIAGHFQKDAPKGSVCVSKVVYNDLFDSSAFKAGNIEIDGLETYVSK